MDVCCFVIGDQCAATFFCVIFPTLGAIDLDSPSPAKKTRRPIEATAVETPNALADFDGSGTSVVAHAVPIPSAHPIVANPDEFDEDPFGHNGPSVHDASASVASASSSGDAHLGHIEPLESMVAALVTSQPTTPPRAQPAAGGDDLDGDNELCEG